MTFFCGSRAEQPPPTVYSRDKDPRHGSRHFHYGEETKGRFPLSASILAIGAAWPPKKSKRRVEKKALFGDSHSQPLVYLTGCQRFETFGFFEWNAAAISAADVEKRRKSARTRIFPHAAASNYHQWGCVF
jgi:hypothetical protein